jgi:tetratricopeptide (TPR) repeat protein
MKTYRIFLASSNELSQDRLEFAAFLLNYNKELKKYKIQLELDWWEDMDDSFNTNCKQDDYNEAIKECHFFIMLFWTKVGKYTKIEFDLARKLQREGKEIYLYCYERTTIKESIFDNDKASKKAFLDEIYQKDKEQFQTPYTEFVKVTEIFRKNFQRLLDDISNKIIVVNNQPAKLLSPNGAANPNVFIGREEELKEIRKRLDNCGKLMLINAEGGIGKTTLAAKYWNESLYDYKHNAWLFCDNGIVNALKELAPKLNVDLAGMDETQQITALKHALSGVHDDFLLVLDNANDDEDIRVFRQTFEGFHWHVLITSRCQGVLEKEQELPITHLPPPLAKALFERYYKEDNAEFEALLEGLLQKINYHTLSVELFAKTLKELAERGETMKHFVNKLETEGIFLGNRAKNIKTDYTHHTHIEGRNSDEILSNFYNFTHLAKEENLRFYLVNMAFLPAEEYNFVFLCELFKQDPIEFEALHQLANKGWLSKNGQKFKINPIIQEIALHKNHSNLPTDAQALLDRLNYILDADAYNLLNVSLTTAEPYVKLVFQINKSLEAFTSDDIGSLNFNAGIYFNNTGNIVGERYAYTQYGIIYQKLLEIDPDNLSYKNGLAISYSKLGGIYEQTGDWKNALLNYQEQLRIFKEIYESSPENLFYKNGLAISYSKLGGIYQQTGDWKNALLNYQEVFRKKKEIYESSPENLSYKNGLAISYGKLGGIYEQIGDGEKAIFNYQEANKYFKEIYESSPENLSYKNGLAISYSKLGGIYEQTGDWKNALLNYQEDFRITKEVYESSPENLSYKNGLAISYLKLGGIYEQTGDWKNALLNYQEYYRISKEIYESSPDILSYKNDLAISYLRLAGVFMANEQISDAVKNYDLCRKMFLEIVQATQGQLIDFVYNYAWTCDKLTQIVKQNVLFDMIDKDQLKSIRREGFKYIQPIHEAGLLRSDKVGVATELSDETWYNF